MPDNYRFGGGVAETTLNPLVAAIMLLAVIAILLLRRKFLLVPLFLIAFLIPVGQTLVIGGAHFFVIRIIILAGCARLLTTKIRTRRSVLGGGFNAIDKAFILWALSRSLAFILLYGQIGALVNQCGFLWDSLGGYLFLRFAIQDEQDVGRTAKVLAFITIIIAICMVFEQRSGSNVFGFVGGTAIPEIREGRIRSQGPFSHAILAGVFGATIAPLFLRLWSTRKHTWLAIAGGLGATCMVVTSGSSTPFGAYVAGILALCVWPIRANMRLVRWGIVVGIVGLAIVMKAPVWFLLAHVDFVGGSSGYHRALLVDQCIQRFRDWWLFGANNNQAWGWDMWDIQNQFVAEALRGGLASFVFFVLIIVRTYRRIGIARRSPDANQHQAWLIWILGAIMFGHVIAFFGADYFDQTRFWWYASLAIVSAATSHVLRKPEKLGASQLTPLLLQPQEVS